MSTIEMKAARDLPPPKLEALIEIMFLAASADGEFSDVEQQHFRTSIESLTNDRVAGPNLNQLLTRFKSDLDKEGRDARLKAVKERLPDEAARKVALSLAIQVTAADGIIRTSERELILETAEALDIDRDQAADMVAKLSPST